jgi:DNA-binding transcriptional ArsR family regulator
MVKYSARSLDALFGALADPTRRRIVAHLAHGEASVSEIAEPIGVTLPAIAKHLAVLEHAGLLKHHKVGRVRMCRLEPTPLKKADRWLADYRVFWEHRLDGLTSFLEREA